MISPYLIEAVYYLFAELSLLNKDVLLLLIFPLFFCVPCLDVFQKGLWQEVFKDPDLQSLSAKGFRRLFCQRGLPRQLACMTERSRDGRKLH